MMALFSRLRRSVALMLWPELDVKHAVKDAIQRALAAYAAQSVGRRMPSDKASTVDPADRRRFRFKIEEFQTGAPMPQDARPPQGWGCSVKGVEDARHQIAYLKQEHTAILARAVEAEDVYAEIQKIIADLRKENADRLGDDRQLGVLICGLISQVALPVSPSVKEGS